MKQEQNVSIVQIEDEYHEIFHENAKVGYAILYIYPDSITIDNIEFDEEQQGKGFGKEVVAQLKGYPGITCLTGDSVPDAMPFWAKMGAIFDWGEMESLGETGHELVGFEISWNR